MYTSCMNRKIRFDLTGQQLGAWTIIKYVGSITGRNNNALWEVRCKCGLVCLRASGALRTGKSLGCKSCALPQYAREKHHAWKGGRSLDKKGYVYLSRTVIRDQYPFAKWRPDQKQRKMLEHVAVLSNYLKRALHKDETVHHRNGDRSDNRLENLELRASKHGPGQTIPDLVAWAKEILARYEPPL